MIPDEQWTLIVDAEQPDSLFPPKVQLIANGGRIQRGQTTMVERGPGYGLDIANGRIHSFPTVDDGNTLRLGIERGRHGDLVILQRHQFTSSGYRYQPTQQNTTVMPPESDRLFWDGTRTVWQAIPTNADEVYAIRNGFGDDRGTHVQMAATVEVEPWWLANDLQACVLGEHSPQGGPSSGWTSFIGKGQWEFVTRSTKTAIQSGGRSPKAVTVGAVDIDESNVGELWGVVIDYIKDPIDGYLDVWVNRAGRGWDRVVAESNGWGWGYSASDPDAGLWYAMLAGFYSWHNDTSAVARFNWDDRYPVRELAIPFAGFINNHPTLIAADLMAYTGERMGLLPPPIDPPPIDPPDPGLERRVAEMEQDVAALKIQVERIDGQVDGLRQEVDAIESLLGRVADAWAGASDG